ncbi:MAG TPA: oligoendopeptidase F, partial [Caulobacteraceae bacterium]
MNAPTPAIAEAPPRWSLDDLYLGRDDPRIEADLAAAEAAAHDLAGLEGALFAARADPAGLGALIDRGVSLFELGINRLWGVGAYAALAGSVDHTDPAWARFEADVRARAARIDAETLFFPLELNRLEDPEIAAALKARPGAARWAPWLRRVRLAKPHELGPDLEH